MASTGTTKCKATTAKGKPCRSAPLSGGAFCFWHDPDRKADAQQARSNGGRARHGRKIDNDPRDPVKLEKAKDVLPILEMAVNDALALENSIARCRLIGYLCGIVVKTFEITDLQRQYDSLERALRQREATQ